MGRSNTVECYKSNDPFEKALVLFRQSRTLLRYCGNNVELVFRSRSFVSTLSKSEISQNKNSFDTVAKTGNNVEAALDFVERIVQRVAFDTVVSTLLLVWTGHNATNQTYRRGAAKAAWTVDIRYQLRLSSSPMRIELVEKSGIYRFGNRRSRQVVSQAAASRRLTGMQPATDIADWCFAHRMTVLRTEPTATEHTPRDMTD